MDWMTRSAAAIPNPGVSAWLTLMHRAKLTAGETVLILGATGVTGKLAVKIAKLLGARRVVAAGRNPEALESLQEDGADAVIRLDTPEQNLLKRSRASVARPGFKSSSITSGDAPPKYSYRRSLAKNLLR